MDLQKLLNKEQYEATITVNGPLLILAGAGSGKTRVLTYRIAHLIKNLSVYPSQILAITFTNKAAGEMKQRVKALVGDEADNMWVSTFHASCVRILRREIDKIGYSKNFNIYDTYDQKTLMKQCMADLGINDKDITDREIRGKIGAQKDALISPEQFKQENQKDYKLNKIADVYLLYQKKLKNNNALDFDDLIYKTVELLKKNAEVLEFYQKKFKYIMVDEYQDTNKAQYELVRLLAEAHKNICVVGDDDQCIYAWRGADIRNILDFEKDYPNAKVVKLEQNYRSKKTILDAANDVIKNNTERKNKILRTDSEQGEKIKVIRTFTDVDEANYIALEIKKLKLEEERSLKDFSILYRTNAQSRVFEDSFIKNDIPYRIIGGLKFYDRKEIKDIMAYLKLINNPLDDVSLRRIINVPKRSIGEATVSKIHNFSEEISECMYSTLLDVEQIPSLSARNVTSINKFVSLVNSFIRRRDEVSVSNILRIILEDTGYLKGIQDSKDPEDMSRVENLEELISAAVDFEKHNENKTIGDFLEKVTLVSDVDNFDKEAESVVLMTVHSAKGLEFPVVFMVGMENGIFPGNLSLTDQNEMEESRRLCYVGITRAREKLYMTSAESRNVFGRNTAHEQSDFISEISEELKECITPKRKSSYQDMKKRYSSNELLYKNESYNPHSIRGGEINSINQIINDSIGDNAKTLTTQEAIPGKKVKHEKFGIGTIITASRDGENTKLSIAFDNMGIKNLILDMAPLELV